MLCREWYGQAITVVKTTPKIAFVYPKKTIGVGDSMIIENTSSSMVNEAINFHWEYLDINSEQIILQQAARDFTFSVPPPGESYNKKIRLTAIDTITLQIIGSDSTTVLVKCQNPPQVGAISVLNDLLVPLQPLSFTVALKTNEPVTYDWEFGDGTKASTPSPIHIYQQSGYYQLKVTVRDTFSDGGECTAQVQTQIHIQGEKKQAYIPFITFDLLKEPPIISNPIKFWALSILFFFLLSAFWSWWKWWNRPFLELLPEDNFIESKLKNVIDILKEQIQPVDLQFSLANQLRIREKGLQRKIDVLPTVHQTIEKGGFLNLQFQYNKQPTEYLILTPNETEPTIALQLFEYLVAFFQEQDVLINHFVYKKDTDKIWNSEYPDGIAFKKLQQFFPQHKLVLYLPIMVNKEASSSINNILFKEKVLQSWPKKVALQPPSSFSLPENALPIFTTNLASIQRAIHYLNQSQFEEETAINEAIRKSTETVQNCELLTDYEQQLAHNPIIFSWFKALVIHPKRTINGLLTMGQCLKVSLDYDSLLAISLLPFFRKDKFDRTLWRNVWATLPKSAEQEIRIAIKASLISETKPINEPTNSLLNTLIAIQNFGIDPTKLDYQEHIRYLLKKEQFSNLQLEELDIIVTRHILNYRPSNVIGGTIANYLMDVPQTIPVVDRPWSTIYFWLAIVLSILSLAWAGTLVLLPNGIHRTIIEQPKSEAAKWNNKAVEQYTLLEKELASQAELEIQYQGFSGASTSAAHYLRKAIAADSTFEKATNNFHKLKYNDGIAYYQQFFTEKGEELQLAKKQFISVLNDDTTTSDSVRFATLFALANIYDLLNEPDSVCAIIDILKQVPDLTFLNNTDVLRDQINYCATNPTKIYLTGKVVDGDNRRPLADVSVNGTNFNDITNQNGQFQGAIILAKTEKELSLQFNVENYQIVRRNYPIISDSLNLEFVSLKLRPIEESPSTLITQNHSATQLNTFEFPIPKMVTVPGGSFIMGCTEGDPQNSCEPDEIPPHEVFLDSFEIGIYEITNEQFATFLNDYGRDTVDHGIYVGKPLTHSTPWGVGQNKDGTWRPNKGYENHPIIAVGYASAVTYCQWISQKTGQIWRLPTEAEWEYAARGGQKGKANNYLYAGGNDLEEVAWYAENSAKKKPKHPNYGTNPVGQKKPNALGVYDMSGNVFEWCYDWYQADFYGVSDGQEVINPICQDKGERRILRGGSWYLDRGKNCRVGDRFAVKYHNGGVDVGFRCVRTLLKDMEN